MTIDSTEFIQFVAEIMEISPDALTLETKYGEVQQWDSIMQLRLVMEIEARYGVEIPIDKVAEINTLNKFFILIKEK